MKIPAVYEQIDEGDIPNSENSARIPRDPNKQKYNYRSFNFQNAQAQQVQMDQQKVRYARQQQVDSYMRAYYQQVKQAIENSKKVSKPRKIENAAGLSPSEQGVVRKVLIPKQQTSETIQINTKIRDKIPKKASPIGYKVFEDIDQEVQPSQKRISRVYLAQDDLIKALHYQTPESYYSKNSHSLPPKIIQEVHKPAPQSYGLGAYGTKTELDALTTLLNKPPTVQLSGLNQLLNQKQLYTYSYPQESPQVHVPRKVVKEYTPIEESVVDVANTQTKPNVLVQPIQIDNKSQKYLELAKAQETQQEKLPLAENVSIIQTNSTNRGKRQVTNYLKRIRDTKLYQEKSREHPIKLTYYAKTQEFDTNLNKTFPKTSEEKSSFEEFQINKIHPEMLIHKKEEEDPKDSFSKNMNENSSILKKKVSKRARQKKQPSFAKNLVSNMDVMERYPKRSDLVALISKSLNQDPSILKRKAYNRTEQKREPKFAKKLVAKIDALENIPVKSDVVAFISKYMVQDPSVLKRKTSTRGRQKRETPFAKKLDPRKELKENTHYSNLVTFSSNNMSQYLSTSKEVAEKVVQKRESTFPSVQNNRTTALYEMEAPNLDYEITTLRIQDLEDEYLEPEEEIGEEVPESFNKKSSTEEYPDYSQEPQDFLERSQEDYKETYTTVLPEMPELGAQRRIFNIDKKIQNVQRALGLIPRKKPKPVLRRKLRRPKLKRRPNHKRPPKHMEGPPMHYGGHPFEVMEVHEVPLKEYNDYYTEFSSEMFNHDQIPNGYTYQTPDSTIHISMNSHDDKGPLTFPNQGHFNLHGGSDHKLNHLQELDAEEGKNIIVINNSNDNHNHGGNAAIKGGHGGRKKHKKGHRGHRGHHHNSGHHHRKMSKSRMMTLDKKLDHVLAKLRVKDILEH